MGRDKTKLASAFIVYGVYHVHDSRFVAGPQALEDILEKVRAALVAERDQDGKEK